MKLFLSSHSAWLAPPFCAVSALYFAEGPFAVITTAMLGIVAVGGTWHAHRWRGIASDWREAALRSDGAVSDLLALVQALQARESKTPHEKFGR